MADVLSQTEIDALLNAVSTGEVETGDKKGKPAANTDAAAASGGAGEGESAGAGAGASSPPTDSHIPEWVAYDLTSQEKFVRGKLQALEGIHERFARCFRMSLCQLLKRSVSVTYTSTDFMRFSEYLTTVLLPTSMNIFYVKEPRGYMIFAVGTKLAYALVDAYFGGSERAFSKVGGREEFTKIEKQLIEKITKQASTDLMESWKLNYPIELEYLRSESNPHFLGSIHGSETVAVVNFDVEMESLSGPFTLLIQLRALDPIQSYLNANVMGEIPVDKDYWRRHWLRELAGMELEVKVNLGDLRRTLGDIKQFKIGNEIILNQDATGPLTVYVEGLPKYRGLMGAAHGSRAVKISEMLPIPSKQGAKS